MNQHDETRKILEIIRENKRLTNNPNKKLLTEQDLGVQEEKDLVRIRASIFVMRESQKAILIGHKGMGLKRIGTEARKDIEKMVNKQVFLKTHIKVKKNWRDDSQQLKKFGYE